MFSPLAAVSTLAFAVIAATGNCNMGPIQCCNIMVSVRPLPSAMPSPSTDGNIAYRRNLSKLCPSLRDLQDTTAQLRLGCSPLSVVGVGQGSQCAARTTT